jgi:hypothetical protein
MAENLTILRMQKWVQWMGGMIFETSSSPPEVYFPLASSVLCQPPQGTSHLYQSSCEENGRRQGGDIGKHAVGEALQLGADVELQSIGLISAGSK